jgi:hypothetical protein
MRRLRLRFVAERSDFGRSILLYGHIPHSGVIGDQPEQVAQPLVMHTLTTEADERAEHAPIAALSMDSAQGLMDELWRCGLRPSEGTGSAGSLAATERHLKDMRAIAFDLLQMNKEDTP